MTNEPYVPFVKVGVRADELAKYIRESLAPEEVARLIGELLDDSLDPPKPVWYNVSGDKLPVKYQGHSATEAIGAFLTGVHQGDEYVTLESLVETRPPEVPR